MGELRSGGQYVVPHVGGLRSGADTVRISPASPQERKKASLGADFVPLPSYNGSSDYTSVVRMVRDRKCWVWVQGKFWKQRVSGRGPSYLDLAHHSVQLTLLPQGELVLGHFGAGGHDELEMFPILHNFQHHLDILCLLDDISWHT